MRKKCKILSVVCVIALTLTILPIQTFAAGTAFLSNVRDQVSQILTAIEPQKALYGLDDVNFNVLSLGEEIPAYNLESGGLIRTTDIRYFPVMSDSKWVATAVVMCSDLNNISVDVSKAYADSYESLTNKSAEGIALIFDDTNAYFYSGGGLTAIASYAHVASRISIDDYVGTVAPATAALSSQSSLTVASISQTRSTSETVSLGVPQVKQPANSSACWAASLSSILGYYGVSESIDGVYAKAGKTPYESASIPECASVLSTKYGMDYGNNGILNVRYNDTLHMLSIITEVGNYSSPILANFSSGSVGHAVVIQGYVSYGTTNNISYMDPIDGYYHMIASASNGMQQIVYENNTLYFDEGIAVYG